MAEFTDRTKKLWYGWRMEAGEHFGCSERTVDDWRQHKAKGTKRSMMRIKLREWCKNKMQQSGFSDEEVDNKIKEAFGE